MKPPARPLVPALTTAASLALLATNSLAAPTKPDVDASTLDPLHPLDDSAPRLSLDVRLGASTERNVHPSGWGGSIASGLSGLYHADLVAVGASAEVNGDMFEETSEYLGLLGGITAKPASWFHVTTLAVGGVHLVQPSEGLHLFGTETITGGETNTALPYVGLRLDPKLRFGKVTKFIIGPTLVARHDLTTTTQEFTTESCSAGWFGAEESCSTTDEQNPIGGLQISAALSAGMEFGL